MGKVMDFTINMSMLFSGDFNAKIHPALQALSTLQEKTRNLQKVSGQITSYQKQSSSLSQLAQKLAQAKQKTEQLSRAVNESSKPNAKLKADYNAALRQYERLSESYQSQKQKLDDLKESLSSATSSTSNFEQAQAQLQSQIARNTQAQDRLTTAQQKYSRVRSQLDWGSMKGNIMASAATVKAFQKPIQIDMEFEQAMANVRAVAAPTPEQFTALRNQALEMGSSTQFTSTQSAQAQEVLMRAGLNAGEVLSVLPNILQTAGAEGMDISQAADILINVTKNMNLPIEELGRVADVMAYTSAHSNTNIAQLGEAALKAAGPFSSMGGTVEELMSTLGAMSNTVRGAEAGTALSGVARRLGKNPKALSQELSRYGIKTMDRQGNFAPFAEIIAQVELQANKLGSKQAAGLRGNIYGMFGSQMQGFGRTLQNGEYKTLLAGTQTESTGSAAQMNRTRNDTLKGDITSLGSAWEGLMIRIGAALDPINRFITGTLTTGIQKLNEWIDQHKDWVNLLVQAGYALGGMMIVRQVWKYADLAYQAFKAWREVKAATAAVEGLSGALEGASKGAGLFGVSLGKALGTLGLIAGACYLIYTYWDDITAAAERAGQAISNIDTNKFAAAKAGTLSRSDADYGLAVMSSTYLPPEIKPHAFGGILTTPHVGLVAEAGPEAIIPLRDKSRGIPLVQKAASILGLGQVSERAGRATPSLSMPTLSIPTISMPTISIPTITSPTLTSPTLSMPTLKEETDNIRQYASTTNSTQYNSSTNSVVERQSPTINITVNGAGEDGQSLAARIAEAVRAAMSDMMSLEERVSYA